VTNNFLWTKLDNNKLRIIARRLFASKKTNITTKNELGKGNYK